MNTPLPSGHSYANTQPFEGRGWCYAESLMSAIFKASTSARLELSRLQGDEWPSEQLGRAGGGASKRQPPMAPDVFRDTLATGVTHTGTIKFTNRGDVDVVASIYERAFLSEMSKASALAYSGLEWGDSQVATLSTALACAHAHGALGRLTLLDLSSNELGDDGCVAFASAAAPRKPCMLACLPSSGTLMPFAQTMQIHLHSNAIRTRGLNALVEAAGRGAFPRLEELILSENLIDDFGALAGAHRSRRVPVHPARPRRRQPRLRCTRSARPPSTRRANRVRMPLRRVLHIHLRNSAIQKFVATLHFPFVSGAIPHSPTYTRAR